MSLSAVIALLAVVWFIVLSITIVLERRSAAATIAWLLALFFLPFIGLVVYRLIGPMRLERKRIRRVARRRTVSEALATMGELRENAPDHAQLAFVGIGLGEAPPLRAHALDLYLDGRSNYDAILAAIRDARHHVHLEYYIWEPDRIGTRLRDLLVAKAREGVAVRMLVDGMGAHKLKRRFLEPLVAAGVEVAWFNRLRLRGLRVRRPDFRTHRKIVVVDGTVGFTGGMNIADAHSEEFGPDYWRDTHVRIAGPAVWGLQRLFLDDWSFATEVPPRIERAFFPPSSPEASLDRIVQIVGSGPDTLDFAIHKAVFTALGQASRRIWITTPYFVPDDAILTALITASLRKVDVRVIVPEKSDSKLVDLAARSYFPELLAAGVRLYEYGPRFIHAKTLVIDDDVAMVGTANLDNRSFRLNFELMAVAYDRALADVLAAAFEADLSHAKPLARNGKLPFSRRLGEAGARLLSPLL